MRDKKAIALLARLSEITTEQQRIHAGVNSDPAVQKAAKALETAKKAYHNKVRPQLVVLVREGAKLRADVDGWREEKQLKCNHSFQPVSNGHGGGVTGQRCTKCGLQEWF